MCIKLPKDKKRPIIKKILNYLWVANVDCAIEYIRGFSHSIIKNQDILDDMCAYLERKRDNICCHAIRRIFNLRLSSNAAEKSNDLVVADRQKHNGMSSKQWKWSVGCFEFGLQKQYVAVVDTEKRCFYGFEAIWKRCENKAGSLGHPHRSNYFS